MKLTYDSVNNEFRKLIDKEKLLIHDKIIDDLMVFLGESIKYYEEGVKIRPKMLIGNNIYKYFDLIPNKKLILIEKTNIEKLKFKKTMKSIIPFCKDGWSLYMDYNEASENIEIGIVKSFTGPIGLSLMEVIFDEEIPDAKVLAIEVINDYEVNIHGIGKNHLKIDFRITMTEYSNIEEIVQKMSNDITKGVENKNVNEIRTVIKKMLMKVQNNVHGTICLIVDEKYNDSKELTLDGRWLVEPISIIECIEELLLLDTYSKYSFTEAYISLLGLLETMLNTDGTTVIDTKGRIRAYNVFVQPKELDATFEGGARKRAAMYLKSCVEESICGVYFQSQDGNIFYERCENN